MTLSGSIGDTLLAALAGVGVFLLLLIIYQMVLADAPIRARARNLEDRRRKLRSDALTQRGGGERRRTMVPIATLRGLLVALNLTGGREVRRISERLARAGWRDADALTTYLSTSLALPVACGVIAYLFASSPAYHLLPPIRILFGLFGLVVGVLGPPVYVSNAIENRGKRIQKALPDALDLLVICSEAGLSMDSAINRVAREVVRSAPEMADELSLTAIELNFLPNRAEAFTNLSKRVDTPSMRGLVTTLIQTERYGTPLTQALRVLSRDFRDKRMMAAEEKAARLPAILTIPMVLFILPTLFVVTLGPAIIQVITTLSEQARNIGR